jgi:hypothetical protein
MGQQPHHALWSAWEDPASFEIRLHSHREEPFALCKAQDRLIFFQQVEIIHLSDYKTEPAEPLRCLVIINRP